MNPCKTIALANQKGGVGKTTTTLNLGAGLARQGYKVLLVDCDPQGNLTTCLGLEGQYQGTTYTLMQRAIQEQLIKPEEIIVSHAEGMDLIPADLELSGMDLELIALMNRERILRIGLSEFKKSYDYILIDTMPSLGMLTVNALTAADSVIIPVQAQYLPVKGMTQLLKSINGVKRYMNRNLRIDGVLITLADGRTNLSRETARFLREQYGTAIKVFDAEIPVSVRAAETISLGRSLFMYDAQGKATQAYEQFAKEVSTHALQRDKSEPSLSR